MSDESRVGSLEMPVPQGAALETFSDPTLEVLLAFLGKWLKSELDSKLSQLTPTSADACPVANRYPYNPEDTFVRNPSPALYAWEESSKVEPWTLRWDVMVRRIRVMYVFEELVKPFGFMARHGLMSAVAKTFAKASERRRKSDFQHEDDPLGWPISLSLNLLDWKMTEGQQGFLQAIPSGGDLDRQVRRGYPAYQAIFEVTERIDQRTISELLADGVISIETGDHTGSTIEFMERIAEAPDGD
jgi:hypothetical protein